MSRKTRRAAPLPAIPYEDIVTREDRAWTERLLARLADPRADDEDRDLASQVLARLADPRSAGALRALLEDRTVPEPIRDAAGSALRDVYEVPADTVRAWWTTGDAVLRHHAVLRMDRRFDDVILPLAADPGNPFYAPAIAAMEFDFEAPEHEALKVAALRHSDPDVRALAAGVLEWDEPLVAIEPLIAALADSDQEVATAAANTLQWYSTRRTFTALSALVTSRRNELREAAREGMTRLREEFATALYHVPSLREWMEPVRTLLDGDIEIDEEADADATVPPQGTRERLTVDEVRARYDDADGAWAEKKKLFRGIDWEAFSSDERAVLVAYFRAHADPWVREAGCGPLSVWNAHDALHALIDDPQTLVQKSAAFHWGRLVGEPDARAAERLWRRVNEPGVGSTSAREALEAYVRHAPRDEAIARLIECARTGTHQSVREGGVERLGVLGATDALRGLLEILSAPPALSWRVHRALIEACTLAGVAIPAPPLDALRDVDDLGLQRAIAEARATAPR